MKKSIFLLMALILAMMLSGCLPLSVDLQRADQLLRNDDTLETLHMRIDALLWTWREAVADA